MELFNKKTTDFFDMTEKQMDEEFDKVFKKMTTEELKQKLNEYGLLQDLVIEKTNKKTKEN